MRLLLAATLVLSPVVLNAQVNQPVQPKAKLTATLVQPANFVTASAVTDAAAASSAPLRISTGVVAPKLVKTVALEGGNSAYSLDLQKQTIVVDMLVDETGTPCNLKIDKSSDTRMDRSVLAAVSQYRFTPGTVSNMPTAVPVKLAVVFQDSSR